MAEYLYLVELGCPACGESFRYIESRSQPVGVMHDVVIQATHCIRCGESVHEHGEWDLREEAEVERVTPTQEREGVSVDG